MRVQFTIDLTQYHHGGEQKAFREVYGTSMFNNLRGSVARVDSNPEDFVRFLCQRDVLGAQNLWRALKVIIVDGDDVQPSKVEIGLSRHEAATIGGMCFLHREFEEIGKRLLKAVKETQE